MMAITSSRTRALIALVVGAATLLASVLLFYSSYVLHTGLRKAALQERVVWAAADSASVGEKLREVEQFADQLAIIASNDKANIADVVYSLCRGLAAHPGWFGGTITYKPGVVSDEPYSRYFARRGDHGDAPVNLSLREDCFSVLTEGESLFEMNLLTRYAESFESYEWFAKPTRDYVHDSPVKQRFWTEPYFDEAVNTTLSTYSAVITSTSGQPVGVVTVDQSLDSLTAMLRELKRELDGFTRLTTPSRKYLAHPNRELISNDIIDDRDFDEKSVTRLTDWLKSGDDAGEFSYWSGLAGGEAWLLSERLKHSSWSLQSTYLKSGFDRTPHFLELRCGSPSRDEEYLRCAKKAPGVATTQRQTLLQASALILLAAMLISYALVQLFALRQRGLWIVAGVISAASLGLTIFVLHQSRINLDEVHGDETIADYRSREAITADFAEKNRGSETDGILTGLEIQTLKLSRSDELTATGELWQVLDEFQLDSDGDGFRFGNAVASWLGKSSRVERRDGLILESTPFTVTVRMARDSSRYPFDLETARIEILPYRVSSGSDLEVALLPDLDSYSVLIPSALPGIEGASLRGWELLRSYYEWLPAHGHSTRGQVGSADRTSFPHLHFTLQIQRHWLDPALSALIPAALVLIMLFVLLLLISRIDASNSLSIAAGMLFVIVFSHIGIRDQIGAQRLFFLESLYFIVYGAILLVTLIIVSRELRAESADQLRSSVEALYWPGVTCALFIATLVTFY